MPLTSPPAISSLSPSTGSVGTGFTLTVNGSRFTGSEQVSFGAYSPATTFVSATQLTAVITSAMVPVAGSIGVHVTNDAGTSGTLTYTVGAAVPTTSAITPSTKIAGGAAFTMTVTGTNFINGATVSFGSTAPAVVTTFVSATSLTVAVPSSMLALAATFSVTVTNPAPGGGTSNAQTFTVTNPTPRIASMTPRSFPVGSGNTAVVIDGSNFINGVTGFTFDSTLVAVTFVSNTRLTATIPSTLLATVGTKHCWVANGSVAAVAAYDCTVVNPTPSITSISPATCLAGAAQFTLTVNGTNFISGCVVKWSGSSLTTTFVSATQVTAVVPAANVAAGGTFQVTVTNTGAPVSNQAAFLVGTSNPAPTLTSISPSTAVAGGAAVTVICTGTNFTQSSVARWNGFDKVTTYISSTAISFVASSSNLATAGNAAVTVFNPTPGGGTSGAQTFTVTSGNPLPRITQLTPSSIAAGSATFTLMVSGTNFTSASVVCWNGSARNTTYISATSLSAVITSNDVASATTVGVSVTTPAPGGGSTDTLPFSVTSANPVPTIANFSPASVAQSSSGFTLTINGTNFVNSSVVKWAGSSRTTTFVSASQLQAAINTGDLTASGTFAITVVNPTPGGGTSNSINFVVAAAGNNPVPTISSVSPTLVAAGAANFTLTVNGTGFVTGGVTTVKFNGTSRTTTFVSSTQVTAAILAADVAAAGSYPVTVVNSTPGGGTSNSYTYLVTFVNQVPEITSLSPSLVARGGGTITLTVTGLGFVPASVIYYGGTSKTTTFINANSVSCSLVAADYPNAPGSISKFNPRAHGEAQSTNATVVRTLDPGSALAPAVTHVGDTGSGVFFPEGDTVALAAGGTEALRATDAGTTVYGALMVGPQATDSSPGNVHLEAAGPSAHYLTRLIPLATSIGTPQSVLQIGLRGATNLAGGGPSLLLYCDNAASEKQFQGRISGVWENVAAGSEAAGVAINVRANTSDVTASTLAAQFFANTDIGIWGHIRGNSGAPGIAAGAGAGTGPTVSLVGSDIAGTITVVTGSSPATSAIVATVTFAKAYASAPTHVSLTPANAAAAALAAAAIVYADSASTTTTVFVIKTGSTGLTASTTYKFAYCVIQ